MCIARIRKLEQFLQSQEQYIKYLYITIDGYEVEIEDLRCQNKKLHISLHQEVLDRRLMHQSTPCVDHRQKTLKNGPNVNQRRLKTRKSTHFMCKSTHSQSTLVEKRVK